MFIESVCAHVLVLLAGDLILHYHHPCSLPSKQHCRGHGILERPPRPLLKERKSFRRTLFQVPRASVTRTLNALRSNQRFVRTQEAATNGRDSDDQGHSESSRSSFGTEQCPV